MKNHKNSKHFCGISLKKSVVLLFLIFSIPQAKDITITAHSGATHTWKGFGVWYGSTGENYLKISPENRADIANRFFKELKFTELSMYSAWYPFHRDTCPAGWSMSKNIHDRYKDILSDVKKVKDDVVLLYGPYGCHEINSKPVEWSDHVAKTVNELVKDYGINVNVTEMYAEPQEGKFGPEHKDWPQTIKMIREKLNAYGLSSVKLVAPSKSGVGDGDKTIDDITASKDAIDNLTAYGFHSYRVSMTKPNRDKLWAAGLKEGFYMTEGGDEWCDGTDAECKQNNFYDDLWTSAGYEASIFANIINDINLGTSYWTWFRGLDGKQLPGSSEYGKTLGFGIIVYDYTANKVVIPPKYYIVKQFSEAFPPGTKMRWCNSNLTGGNRFENIYETWGDRPPIQACTGLSEDGHWSVGLLNTTGSPATKWGEYVCGKWPAAEKENITVHIEELANAGDMEFEVYRFTMKDHTKKEDNVTMKNGNITVSVNPSELVTLKSVKTTTGIIPKKEFSSTNITRNNFSQIITVGSSPVKFSLSSNMANSAKSTQIGVYNLMGKCVKKLVLTNNTQTILWDKKDESGKKVSPGIFLVKTLQ